MKILILIIILSNIACNGRMEVSDSTHTVRAINPIIEYCERLYPEILYPDLKEQEIFIVDCLRVCSDTNSCTVDINQFNIPQGF